MELLKPAELAAILKRPRQFVTMMKRAGYRFRYEAANRTTREHALAALERSPNFRACHYQVDGWERLPKLLAEPDARLSG